MLDSLELTPAEKAFAFERAARLCAKVFDDYSKKRAKDNLRPIAMAAAVAIALTMTDDHVKAFEKQ